jgi:hypothetical protein
VQIWKDSGLVNGFLTSNSTYDYKLPGYGTYRWQVLVVRGGGAASELSAIRSFGYAQKKRPGGGGATPKPYP